MIGNIEGSQHYIEFDVPKDYYVVGAMACQDEQSVRGLEFTLMKIVIWINYQKGFMETFKSPIRQILF